MKTPFILIPALLFLLTISNLALSQDSIRMTTNNGTESKELRSIIDFEGIYMKTLNFGDAALNEKYYEVTLQEYKNGQFVKSTVLFDGAESDFFKINGNSLSLQFLVKLADGQLKVALYGPNFTSAKKYFKLSSRTDDYVLKDFFGSPEQTIRLSPTESNPVLAIITPSVHKDGSASYCEVVQTGVKPEDFGKHFHIPHYFLISIRFKS